MGGIAGRYSCPLIALVVMIAACGGVGEPEDDNTISGAAEITASEIATTASPSSTTAGDPDECSLDDPAVVFRGELLFQTIQPSQPACSWCHSVTAAPPAARFGNRDLRGNGPALRGVMSRHSEDFVRAQIVSGGGEMPARGAYVDHEALDEFGCTQLDQILAYLYSISGEDVLMDDVELEYDRAEAVAGAEIFAETCEVCHAGRSQSWRGSGLFTAATRADACLREALQGHGGGDDLAREGEHAFVPRSAVERRHSRPDRLSEESGRRVIFFMSRAWPRVPS